MSEPPHFPLAVPIDPASSRRPPHPTQIGATCRRAPVGRACAPMASASRRTRTVPLRAHAHVERVLPADGPRVPGRQRAVRVLLLDGARVGRQRAAGLVRGRVLLQRADHGHHRLRRHDAGDPLRAHRGDDRGDDRHPVGRADHRHHLRQVRAADRARAVQRQGDPGGAQRRAAPLLPRRQLAAQPGVGGAAPRDRPASPRPRARARRCAARSRCRWCATTRRCSRSAGR